ncbi:unnamed protein product [[Candida] boidinii]|uniref:Unnamed protein product n=1 Tax=Candida boidinii TaxID=5477 RepID=A0A9W6T595_CANBO|nr:unnamed protein product [[Candida] boidinii]
MEIIQQAPPQSQHQSLPPHVQQQMYQVQISDNTDVNYHSSSRQRYPSVLLDPLAPAPAPTSLQQQIIHNVNRPISPNEHAWKYQQQHNQHHHHHISRERSPNPQIQRTVSSWSQQKYSRASPINSSVHHPSAPSSEYYQAPPISVAPAPVRSPAPHQQPHKQHIPTQAHQESSYHSIARQASPYQQGSRQSPMSMVPPRSSVVSAGSTSSLPTLTHVSSVPSSATISSASAIPPTSAVNSSSRSSSLPVANPGNPVSPHQIVTNNGIGDRTRSLPFASKFQMSPSIFELHPHILNSVQFHL